MKVPFVDLKKQLASIRPEIDSAIKEVIDSVSFIKGEVVTQFEESFSELIGVKHTIGVANGTDALFIALKMLRIGHGDEVITVANTFIATAEAITATGAKVVFVDINPETYNINTKLIEEKITKKTKAIVAVHLFGQMAEMDELVKIANKHNLFIIEDAAQAHLSEYKLNRKSWKMAGTVGHISTFSFFPGKNLGAFGDAGAIVTNNSDYAKNARMLANHGRLSKFDHEIEGYNCRMDTIQAAVLNVKLKHIVSWTNIRRILAKRYLESLNEISQIQLPAFKTNQNPVWHLFVVLVNEREELRKFLKDKNIETGIHYPIALPNLTAYNYLQHHPVDFPVASDYQNKVLSLPIFPEMTLEQIDYVCNMINKFYNDSDID